MQMQLQNSSYLPSATCPKYAALPKENTEYGAKEEVSVLQKSSKTYWTHRRNLTLRDSPFSDGIITVGHLVSLMCISPASYSNIGH